MKIRAMLALFTLAVPAISAPTAGAEPFRLIVTDLEPPLVPNSVMYLAEELGYFEREGVDVTLVPVQQTPSAVAALRAGDGDMANISTEAALQVVARGQMDLRAVTSPDKAIPFLIAARREIATTAELAGASFAIGRPGSLDQSLSTRVMEAHGIDPDEVRFVSIGQPAIRARALAAGRVDATTMSIGVWLSLPDKQDLHVLVPQDTYFEAAPLVSKVNVVRAETLQERPEEVEAVVRALLMASRHFAEHTEAWVDAIAEARPDIARADLERLGDSFAGSWSVNGGLDAANLSDTAAFIFAGEDFADLAQPELEDWVEFSILDSILAETGTREDQDPAGR